MHFVLIDGPEGIMKVGKESNARRAHYRARQWRSEHGGIDPETSRHTQYPVYVGTRDDLVLRLPDRIPELDRVLAGCE
jgi:hypothetical protein